MRNIVFALLTVATTALAVDLKNVKPKLSIEPSGPDLVATDPFVGECSKPDCSQCPTVTIPIFVRNVGNATSTKPIVVTVKHNGQVIQTWTTTAPAAGAQVMVGSYTTFPWNCPAITSVGCASANTYPVTVDAPNVVQEKNEQNNILNLCIRYPERTTFQAK